EHFGRHPRFSDIRIPIVGERYAESTAASFADDYAHADGSPTGCGARSCRRRSVRRPERLATGHGDLGASVDEVVAGPTGELSRGSPTLGEELPPPTSEPSPQRREGP